MSKNLKSVKSFPTKFSFFAAQNPLPYSQMLFMSSIDVFLIDLTLASATKIRGKWLAFFKVYKFILVFIFCLIAFQQF